MLTIPIRVYLEDTDAGGIVYHASYLRFMERARTEALRGAGLEQSQTFKEDLSFVVHKMDLEFRSPAHLDDQLEVTCAFDQGKGASVHFEQEVRGAATGHVHCRARVTVVCIALTNKRPRRIPAQILESLAQAASA